MENMKLWCVYMHTTPSNKRYIGITSNKLNVRWGHNGHNYCRNRRFYSAIVHHGWENITHEILYQDLTEEEAKKAEIRLIKQYRTNEPEYGYNNTIGGDGTSGRHRTDAEKEAIRRGHIGRSLSEETRKRIGESNRGKSRGKGRKWSEETNKKRSDALKGRIPWNKGLRRLDDLQES